GLSPTRDENAPAGGDRLQEVLLTAQPLGIVLKGPHRRLRSVRPPTPRAQRRACLRSPGPASIATSAGVDQPFTPYPVSKSRAGCGTRAGGALQQQQEGDEQRDLHEPEGPQVGVGGADRAVVPQRVQVDRSREPWPR